MVFLDTDVLIDCLRGVRAAKAWLKGNSSVPFQVPGIAAMELVVGARDKVDLGRIQTFLNSFSIVWPEAQESAHAYELLGQYRLSSSISIPDCLIAAMTLLRSARLYTLNLRHFQLIAGLDAQAPYDRDVA